MKKRRLLWADIIRIAAIYLVLSVHSSSLDFNVNTANVINWILFAVAKVCVPLFIMLSGGLLLTKDEPYGLFYKKRASRYLLPWFFWSLVTAGILYLQSGFRINAGFIPILKTSILSFWFLPMLTCLYLLTPSIRKYLKAAKSSDIIIVLVLWFLAVSLLPFTINNPAFPLFIDNSLLTQTIRFFGYYLLGYLITKYEPDKKMDLKTMVFIFLLGLEYVILMTLRSPSGELYFSYHSPGVVLESIGGFLLIKKFIGLYKAKLSKHLKNLIFSLSSASYGIYLSHLAVKNLLIGFPFLTNKFIPSGYVIGLLLFIICFLLISLMRKISLIGKVSG